MAREGIMKASLAALIFSAAGIAGASAGNLAIYNWSDYFGDNTVKNYEKKTGTKVTLDHYDSNEVLETKLLTGKSGYDVVFPASSNAERQLKAGALLPIDTGKLANYGNLDPKILAALDKVPGGRKLGVPYTWGTIGIAYNVAKIKKHLGDQPMNSWNVLFDPMIAGKLKDCGIAVLDSPVEMTGVTLKYLGHDPYGNDKKALAKVKAALKTAAKSVRYFSNQKSTDDLAAGDICMAVMYSGDAGIAQARAAENGNGVEIAYSIPKEGTMMWIDLMAIPADSTRKDEAYRFIDYMLQPTVIAEVTNKIFFANANRKARPLINPDILADPGLYPDAETLKRLFPDKNLDARSLRTRTRLWTSVKTGI